jgi:class 3 adenylate cyclase
VHFALEADFVPVLLSPSGRDLDDDKAGAFPAKIKSNGSLHTVSSRSRSTTIEEGPETEWETTSLEEFACDDDVDQEEHGIDQDQPEHCPPGEDDIDQAFQRFSGGHATLDSAKFIKVCKDCGLFSKNFTSADADIIYLQMKRSRSESSSGAYKLDIFDFRIALSLIAKKKCSCPEDRQKLKLEEEAVIRAVSECNGPSKTSTKADAVRFHDDFRLYTGTHKHGGPDAGRKGKGTIPMRLTTELSTGAKADPMPSFVDSLSQRLLLDATVATPCRAVQHVPVPAMHSDSISASCSEDESVHEGPESSIDDTFKAYSKHGKQLDGKSFAKLCKDCNFIGDGLTEVNVDLIFAKFKVKGQRHMDLYRFKKALTFLALKKRVSIDAIFSAVSQSAGPVLTGSRTDCVRFHDDFVNAKTLKTTVDGDDVQCWRKSLRPSSCSNDVLPRFVAQRVGDVVNQATELDAQALAENRRHRLELRRSVKTKPPRGTDDVTMVFTDVQGSTSLWEFSEKAMNRALQIHDEAMRRNMAKHAGYEVMTEGDAFQIVFHDAVDAVGFCLDVQNDLYKAEWPDAILNHPDAQVEKGAWRGLRVRMGMHTGRPSRVDKHEVTGKARYSGRSVAIAKAVEGVCHGGQILITGDTFSSIDGHGGLTQLQSPQVVDLGEHSLRVNGLVGTTTGTDDTVRLLQLVPAALAHDYFSSSAYSTDGKSTCSGGRTFPKVESKAQISPGFDESPAGPSITLCFVFTKGARDLIVADPDLAMHALGMLRQCVRSLLGNSDTRGYECQEDEGAFMLAFESPANAAAFAAALQQELPQLPWHKALRECNQIFENGLRASIGVFEGSYTSRGPHVTTGRADYFGTMVNRTARVAAAAHPGQVLFGSDVSDKAHDSLDIRNSCAHVELIRLGAYAFKGIEDPLVVHELRMPAKRGSPLFEVFPEPKAKARVGD